MNIKSRFLKTIVVPFFQKKEEKYMLNYGNSGYNCLNHVNRLALTLNEKNEIYDYWGKCIPDPKIGFDQFEIYKALRGFDVRFVPNSYFHTYIAKYLLNEAVGKVLSNKNMLWSFLYGLPQAETIIRKYEGTYFDSLSRIIDERKALDIVEKVDYPMIIKSTIDSCGGKSIKLIEAGWSDKNLSNLFAEYGNNFIIQTKVSQSSVLSTLNETSLNTIRVNTLFINDKIIAVSLGIRIGQRGAIVDNASSDGVMVGINLDGSLKDWAFDLHGNKYNEINGIKLSGFTIPNIVRIKELAINAHIRMAQSRMIAWDIALDKDDNPLILEANVGYKHFYPGIRAIQLCNGPVFGDYTQEVIEFIVKQQLIDKEKGLHLNITLERFE